MILIGYNDAERIAIALNSLRDQSFRDIEIIAVDDCSTDSSVEVLQSAAELDPRIKVEVLSSNSGGCSAPRNRGIELATAPFIMFCDSDDTYDRHAVRNLHSAVTSMEADLVVGAAKRIVLNTGEEKIWRPELHATVQVFQGLRAEPGLLFDTISVNKIYRAEFLRENGIEFPSGLLFEDQLFTLKCFLAASRIGVIPEVVYNWNVERGTEDGSITQSRRELRNVSDRIAINQLMDAQLQSQPDLVHAKNQKFLQHELSLYLTTLFGLEEGESGDLVEALSAYIRTIPIEDFDALRPGIRVATYYLLTGDQVKMREALWWEKGGAFINTTLVGSKRELWSGEIVELLGRPASWWLNIHDLHLTLIPFDQRRFFANLSALAGTNHWQIDIVDFARDLPADTQVQVLLRENKTGALLAFSGVPVESVAGTKTFRVNLESSNSELIQDRGINSGEHGVVQVQITCTLGVNRTELHIGAGEAFPVLSITRHASLDCADKIEFQVQQDRRVRWRATGSARSFMGAVRKLRRSRGKKSIPSFLPLVKVPDRPTVIFAPAELPTFDTRLNRFDTQAWINELGTSVYLLVPRETFTPTPQRSRFAYRSLSASQHRAALSMADIVITDRPELIDDPRAIGFRRDLGAARYLLPPLDPAVSNVEVIEDQRVLHARVRERLGIAT